MLRCARNDDGESPTPYQPDRLAESPPHPESALCANSGLSPQAGRDKSHRATTSTSPSTPLTTLKPRS
ncbi:hypothetical protein E4K65_11755 [Bradyrhizobium niftali]|uniref:Uncharacterized protein n=1 Tax=Bradyrhizobium niftali TaxID=2560055 RepID=A0A4Y9M156_9BRAD|nr:hypothetical protein E4K65_11755 [Bradyrhizobium niftali]